MFSDGEKKRRVEAVRKARCVVDDRKWMRRNQCVWLFPLFNGCQCVLRAAVCIVFSMFQPRWYCRLRDILRGIEKCWNRD